VAGGALGTHHPQVTFDESANLANDTAIALNRLGRPNEALEARTAALKHYLLDLQWGNVRVCLANMAISLETLNRLSNCHRLRKYALQFATGMKNLEHESAARLDLFSDLVERGQVDEAEQLWALIRVGPSRVSMALDLAGFAEWQYARLRFQRGALTDADLTAAEAVADKGKQRAILRDVRRLRGEWYYERADFPQATRSLQAVVEMADQVNQSDFNAEALLTLARWRAGNSLDLKDEASRLEGQASARLVGELWHAAGEFEAAQASALAAYRWAWAEGEPYVHRFELERAGRLLSERGVAAPELPILGSAAHTAFDWEAGLETRLRQVVPPDLRPDVRAPSASK
jgi:hypothetical protein